MQQNRIGLPRDIPLSDVEASLVAACAAHAARFDAGHEIAFPGMSLNRPKCVLSGWVGLSRTLADGRRQIADLNLPGELTAFDPKPGTRAKLSYIALTPVRLIDVGELLEKAVRQAHLFPGLASLFHAAAEDAHARLLDQILRVGRLLAHEKVAHLALDLHRRFDRVGLTTGQSFPMPLTQETLGDVLGMSTVHVNRTLQQLRRDGLLRTASGRWEILDMDHMAEMASGTHASAV